MGELASGKVGCGDPNGKVVMKDGVKTAHGVSLTYRGTNAANCTWIQFEWREATAVAGGQHVRATPSDKFQEGPKEYPYTDDPKLPEYHVDAPDDTGPSFPYLERGAGDLTMLDDPGHTVEAKNRSGVEIVEVAHYDAYLVCDRKACAHLSWTRTWTSKDGDQAPGSEQNPSTTEAGTLDDKAPDQRMIDQLNKQFPNQQVL